MTANAARAGYRRIRDRTVEVILGQHLDCYHKEVADGGHLTVLVGPEDDGWHLSISHRTDDLRPGRYPTWDEIVEARYVFCPAHLTMAMLLPPREEYVNVHETTFHLWNVPRPH